MTRTTSCDSLRHHHGTSSLRHHDARGVSLALSYRSACLLPLCCAAHTPRTPHTALALLLLVHRTHRATTAHTAPPALACTAVDSPVAASSGLAHGRTGARAPRSGGLHTAHGPASRARTHRARSPVRRMHRAHPPRAAAGSNAADSRHHARTTAHDDEKMPLRAHKGTKPETPVDGVHGNTW